MADLTPLSAPIITGAPEPPQAPYSEFLGLEGVPPTTQDVLSDVFRENLRFSPTASGVRALGREIGDQGRLLDADEANSRYGVTAWGKKELTFAEPTHEDIARDKHRLKIEELASRRLKQAAQGGFVETAGGLVVGLLSSFVDPLNIAAAFVPVVREARYLEALGAAGSTIGRLAVRARYGALEGLVGTALVEPITAVVARSEQADYDLYDSLTNIAFGGLLGGGLHATFGAVGDRLGISGYARMRADQEAAARAITEARQLADLTEGPAVERAVAPAQALPVTPFQRAVDDLPLATKEAALRTAVADLVARGEVSNAGLVLTEGFRANVPPDAIDGAFLLRSVMPEGRPGVAVETGRVLGTGFDLPERSAFRPGEPARAEALEGLNRYVVARDEAGRPVGVLRMTTTEAGGRQLDAGAGLSVFVTPESRRQGIARSLYAEAERQGFNIRDLAGRGDLTPQGAALNEAMARDLAARREAPAPRQPPEVATVEALAEPQGRATAPAQGLGPLAAAVEADPKFKQAMEILDGLARIDEAGRPAAPDAEIPAREAAYKAALVDARRKVEADMKRGPEKRPEGVSMVTFIRDRGGIKDDAGALKAMDLGKRFPGIVNNKTGISLDYMREALEEAGYLRSRDLNQTTSVADLLDALDRTSRGETIYPHDQTFRMGDTGTVDRFLAGHGEEVAIAKAHSKAYDLPEPNAEDMQAIVKQVGGRREGETADAWRERVRNAIDDWAERKLTSDADALPRYDGDLPEDDFRGAFDLTDELEPQGGLRGELGGESQAPGGGTPEGQADRGRPQGAVTEAEQPQGRLTAEDTARLAAADDLIARAEAESKAWDIAAACAAGGA